MTRVTSAQLRSTFCSVTPRKQKRFWVGNRRCDSMSSSESWWTRTWIYFRATRRGSASEDCHSMEGALRAVRTSQRDVPTTSALQTARYLTVTLSELKRDQALR